MVLDLYVCSFSLTTPFNVATALPRLREATTYLDNELGRRAFSVAEGDENRPFSQGAVNYDLKGIRGLYRVGIRSKTTILEETQQRIQLDFAHRTGQTTRLQEDLAEILGEEFTPRRMMQIIESNIYDPNDPFEQFRRYELLLIQRDLPSWLTTLGWRLVSSKGAYKQENQSLSKDTFEFNKMYALFPILTDEQDESIQSRIRERSLARFMFNDSRPTILNSVGNTFKVSSLCLTNEGLKLFYGVNVEHTIVAFSDACEELLLRLSSFRLNMEHKQDNINCFDA